MQNVRVIFLWKSANELIWGQEMQENLESTTPQWKFFFSGLEFWCISFNVPSNFWGTYAELYGGCAGPDLDLAMRPSLNSGMPKSDVIGNGFQTKSRDFHLIALLLWGRKREEGQHASLKLMQLICRIWNHSLDQGSLHILARGPSNIPDMVSRAGQ